MYMNETIRARATAATPEMLSPAARLGLMIAICATSWALFLGVGYGIARLF